MSTLQQAPGNQRVLFEPHFCPDIRGNTGFVNGRYYGLVPERSHCGFKPGATAIFDWHFFFCTWTCCERVRMSWLGGTQFRDCSFLNCIHDEVKKLLFSNSEWNMLTLTEGDCWVAWFIFPWSEGNWIIMNYILIIKWMTSKWNLNTIRSAVLSSSQWL